MLHTGIHTDEMNQNPISSLRSMVIKNCIANLHAEISKMEGLLLTVESGGISCAPPPVPMDYNGHMQYSDNMNARVSSLENTLQTLINKISKSSAVDLTTIV